MRAKITPRDDRIPLSASQMQLLLLLLLLLLFARRDLTRPWSVSVSRSSNWNQTSCPAITHIPILKWMAAHISDTAEDWLWQCPARIFSMNTGQQLSKKGPSPIQDPSRRHEQIRPTSSTF